MALPPYAHQEPKVIRNRPVHTQKPCTLCGRMHENERHCNDCTSMINKVEGERGCWRWRPSSAS